MTSPSTYSQSTRPTEQVLWEELLVLSRFRSLLQADKWNYCPLKGSVTNVQIFSTFLLFYLNIYWEMLQFQVFFEETFKPPELHNERIFITWLVKTNIICFSVKCECSINIHHNKFGIPGNKLVYIIVIL